MSFKGKLLCAFLIVSCGLCWKSLGALESTSHSLTQKRVIIIGASSGIGAALAEIFIKRNAIVGIVGRRGDLLNQIKQDLGQNAYCKVIDVTKYEEARDLLKELIAEMGGMDIIIISAGTGTLELDWEQEKQTVETNVLGFLGMINYATDYFSQKNDGHIVGISSIAGLRGSYDAPSYSASKAFVSNYMTGLRARLRKANQPIFITDIQPGFVDTAMAQADTKFWVATPQEAASQIYDAIATKQELVYVTKRWRLIAWLYKLLPDFLFYKLP